MTQTSESDEQVVALKQQIQQLQGRWRKEQCGGAEPSTLHQILTGTNALLYSSQHLLPSMAVQGTFQGARLDVFSCMP